MFGWCSEGSALPSPTIEDYNYKRNTIPLSYTARIVDGPKTIQLVRTTLFATMFNSSFLLPSFSLYGASKSDV